MGRVVAIDWGTVRIGVAISDMTRFLASALGKIERQKENRATIASLLKLLLPYQGQIDEIIIGYPLHMNGKESRMSQEVLLFKEALEKETSFRVSLWDERLSSLQAERLLLEGDVSRKKRKGVIDAMAAALFLQSYLDQFVKA